MKHVIFSLSLYTLILWNLSCTKEAIDTPETPPVAKTVLYVEDFTTPTFGRDGEKAPFGFDGSWAIIDVFKPGVPQMAINQNSTITDRMEINRVPLSPNVNYQGIKSLYVTDFYFVDSTKNFTAKIYWDYLNGESNVLYPDGGNNQFDINNHNEWTRITRRTKTEDYLDLTCGIDKKRVEHRIETPLIDENHLVQSNRCNSNLFSFKYY